VYGLRYDYDAQPQNVPRDRSNPIEAPLDDGIHRDANNVSPRAGFTWEPLGGARTLIRGGYGRFYDKGSCWWPATPCWHASRSR